MATAGSPRRDNRRTGSGREVEKPVDFDHLYFTPIFRAFSPIQ